MRGNQLIRRIALLLKNLFKMLPGTLAGSIPTLQSDVRPSESLSTFVSRADEVDRRTSTIRHTRLMPRPNKNRNGRLETSVCRSEALTNTQVWAICSAHFDVFARMPAIGRGVGPAKTVFDVDLGIDADGNPYPEHANIIGWYDSPGKPKSEIKHFWMDKAQTMARHFKYLPREN